MDRQFLTTRLIAYQLAAFGILLIMILGDELWEFPHFLFGPSRGGINWDEVIFEVIAILSLAVGTAYSTGRLIRRIKYLEGFLPICAHCKKIRDGEAWRPVEEVISSRSDAKFTHGFCPECMAQHYGAYRDAAK